MENINEWMQGDTARVILKSLGVVLAFVAVILLYRFITRRVAAHAGKTGGRIDDFVVEVLKLPFLLLLSWIAVRILTLTVFPEMGQSPAINHILRLLLIATIGWILIKITRVIFYFTEKKVDERAQNSFESRSNLTKLTFFERMIVGVIIVVTVSIALMTFDRIRTLGLSLLTSAGIAGIIVGFAAQKSLSMILAGIQIAITQPIKLNDLIVYNGDTGRIEEISLTYIVVKLWNKKRVILPVTYFLDQPFENWTRLSSDILGTATFNVDYRVPLDEIREHVREVVKKHPKWDKETFSLDIDQMKETCMQLKVVAGSPDSDASTALMNAVREAALKYLQTHYPDSLVHYHIHTETAPATEENPKIS